MSSGHWIRDCYFTLVLVWLLLFLVILVHEWAHWTCARRLGFRAPRVVVGIGRTFLRVRWRGSNWHFQLFPVLGFVQFFAGRHPVPGRKVLVALAGPAANLAVAAVLFLALPAWDPMFRSCCGPVALVRLAADAYSDGPAAILYLFACLNLSTGLFNLLPIPPLDGSALLEEPAQALHRASPGSFNGEWWSGAWMYAGAAVMVAVNLFVLLSDFLI